MTEEDLEALRVGYEFWNRGEPAFELVHPEMEWSPGAESPDAGTFTGRDGFVDFVRSWTDAFDDFRLEPLEMTVAGENVIVMLRQSGRGRGSGVELDIETVHMWTIRDGVAVAWSAYRNRDEAVAAIGDRRE